MLARGGDQGPCDPVAEENITLQRTAGLMTIPNDKSPPRRSSGDAEADAHKADTQRGQWSATLVTGAAPGNYSAS